MYKILDIHTHTYPEAIAAKAKVALEKFYEFTCEGNGTVNDLACMGAKPTYLTCSFVIEEAIPLKT